MPPRNAPLPNAVNLFNCTICDKGYPRQTDYENHLRSYDHNHRQRLAEMKKLTDANASDAPRLNKGPLDMRSIPQGDTTKKSAGLGPRFKKVGGAPGAVPGAVSTGGSRFRRIGDAKEDKVEEKEEGPKFNVAAALPEPVPAAEVEFKTQADTEKDEDIVMADNDDDIVTWEEYDVTKPSECDHVNCLGCQVPKNSTYENGWLVMGSA
ncbi:hypothetical protein SLS60_002062 [Paraconiothyrium brasiliense]|uniref:C2H2-type domain-containing protein n=1 Tax=Paraconiothyrium brasiliense TaxID=300254 RepID=A0ABR3S150_9PLEO